MHSIEVLAVIFFMGFAVGGYPMMQTAISNDIAHLKRHNVPTYLMERYLTFVRGNEEETSANVDTERVIHGKKIVSRAGSFEVFFDLSALTKKGSILTDQVHVYLSHVGPNDGKSRSTYNFTVMDIFSRQIIVRQSVKVNCSGWYKIPLQHWTRHWLQFPMTNHGFKIILSRNGRLVKTVNPTYHGKSSSQFAPYLLLRCKEEQASLPDWLFQHDVIPNGNYGKLEPVPTTEGQPERIRNARAVRNASCHYTTISVSVKGKLNFTGNMISSSNYTTKKCYGSCPPSRVPPATATTCDPSVQDCCVPCRTKSFPVMFKEASGNFVLKVIRNAIVEDCACSSSLKATAKPTK